MVKDVLREIKRKLFQFVAIAVITFLGVGFFIGIQVTGYNMRQTGDAYMREHTVLDFTVRHTLGIDDAMLEDIQANTGGSVVGVTEEDAFVKGANFDDVMKIYALDATTQQDLTLTEGREPRGVGEAVVDQLMTELYGFKLGDTLTIHEQNFFKTQTVTIVGFAQSSLYMNMERGQSSLGSGKTKGFMYASDLEMLSDTPMYSQARIVSPDVTNLKDVLEQKATEISDARFERIVKDARETLQQAQDDVNAGRATAAKAFLQAEHSISQAQNRLGAARGELETGIDALAGTAVTGTLVERLAQANENYLRNKSALEDTIQTLQKQLDMTEDPETQAVLQQQIVETTQTLSVMETQYAPAYAQLQSGVDSYNQGVTQLENQKFAFQAEKKETLDRLDAAQHDIDDGLEQINTSSHGDLIVQSRSEFLIGYQEFYDDSYRIENIGKVFPMIFFGVSVLVTLSTISRMIDESRMQIGVYKALGYGALKITLKYVLFAGIAWGIGSLLGMVFGFLFIPNIIYNAYRIMYITPDLIDGFIWQYALIPLGVSLLSSAGVAFVKSYRTTRAKTATLLRPLAPKKGQRVLLERIPFLWNRFSFLFKVSVRNLFRNKTRFLMTVVGIGGCCGLLITGFGIRHSIYSITDKQFHEVIAYDGLAFYDTFDMDTSLFDDYSQAYVTSVTLGGKDVSLYAAEDLEHMSKFVRFHDRKTKQPLPITKDSVFVSEKIANLLNLKIGDSISFALEGKQVSVPITGIVENYANHYIYMGSETYKTALHGTKESNLVLFQTQADHQDVSEVLLQSKSVLTVQFLDDIAETYKDMMGNFDVVIIVIVACALALEIIVLMNLISMNMSERQKELATLKVLGFYPNELASYVLRENVILTLIALAFGMIFGRILHLFVVVSAEIDMVMFNRELLWTSYALALAMTFGLSVALNLFMARKADKVNMSEALKTFDA